MLKFCRFKKNMVFIGLILSFSVSGCAFGKFGRTKGNYFGLERPVGVIGENMSYVLSQMGLPDQIVSGKESEYWGYKNRAGWFIFPVGKTEEKTYIVEFKGDKVVATYLLNMGSSMGLFIPQGAVVN